MRANDFVFACALAPKFVNVDEVQQVDLEESPLRQG